MDIKRNRKQVKRYSVDTRKQLKSIIKPDHRKKEILHIPEIIIGEEYFYYFVKWKDSDEINYELKKRIRKTRAFRQIHSEWNKNIKKNPFYTLICLLKNKNLFLIER